MNYAIICKNKDLCLALYEYFNNTNLLKMYAFRNNCDVLYIVDNSVIPGYIQSLPRLDSIYPIKIDLGV